MLMRKKGYNLIRLIVVMLLGVAVWILSGPPAGDAQDPGPSATEVITPMPTAASSPVPVAVTPAATLELEDLATGSSVEKFFGSPLQTRLNQIQPLLMAASQACFYQAVDFKAADNPLDNAFAWLMADLLLNSQCQSDNQIVSAADGSLQITANSLRRYFSAMIPNFKGEIPAIPDDFADHIRFDAQNQTYALKRIADDALKLKIREITIDAKTAVALISLELSSGSGEILAAVKVAIQAESEALLGYRVLSVTQQERRPPTSEMGQYANSRFGYTLSFPLIFYTYDESENGDGATFLSDGTAQLAVWGQNNTENKTIQTFFEAAKKDNPGYTAANCVQGHYSLTYPGDPGVVVFEYASLKNRVLVQFIFQYPVAETAYYQEISSRMAASLILK